MLPARAVLRIDFVGRSIMEVLIAAHHVDQTVAILSAIGYKYEKDFNPLLGPSRTIASVNSKEESAKNAQACLDRVQRMQGRLKNYVVQQGYKALERRAILKLEQTKNVPTPASNNSTELESQ